MTSKLKTFSCGSIDQSNILCYLFYIFVVVSTVVLNLRFFAYDVSYYSNQYVKYQQDNEQHKMAEHRLSVIHMVQGDKDSILEYPAFDLFRDRKFNNDLIYYNYIQIRTETENYYNDSENTHNIYSPNRLSWTEGRNFMLKYALQIENNTGIKYDYFAFFDDDSEWKLTSTGQKMKEAEWIEMYEYNFKMEMLKYEPAIMAVSMGSAGKYERNHFNPNHCQSKVCSIYHHDAIANWVHRELIQNKIAFPYCTKFDDICMWESQRILVNTAYVMYFNHILMFRDFYVDNPTHRAYARNWVEGQKQSHQYLKYVLRQIFGNDWVFNNYYDYKDPSTTHRVWFFKTLHTFSNLNQYKLVGYPAKKFNMRYDNYAIFNNTKPIIPFKTYV